MPGAIEIENFSYTYPDGTVALSDISLKISPGERIALIGPNGAGKSTLLLAVNGFLKGSGRVIIDGKQVTGRNKKEIHTAIGCVLQNPDEQLFMPTLFDDVAFGPLNMGITGDELTERVEQVLKTVGLSEMAHKAPHHLSAGQKRAAAIATVLAMSPAIIAMDEPDSHLDPRSRKSLVELLAGLDQTLVIATCNMNFAARLCSRAVVMDKGHIVADGRVGEIMTDSQLMLNHGLEVASDLNV
jgi:cobalt/nickel transport system ATP-binding protein